MLSVKRAALTLAVLALATCALFAQPETTNPPKEQPAPTSGTVEGILTAKGENWIAVKAEGAREPIRYLAVWRGGLPSEGGAPDKATVEAIKKLMLANLVSVTWEMQENQRRIVTVKMIISDQKAGTVSGTVVAKGDAWIEVKPKEGPTERYTAKWVPGPAGEDGKPKGGGMDKEMVKTIATIKIGSTVDVNWTADERKRLESITVTAEPPAPTAAPEGREGDHK